jgi:penicillin-binding protein 1A
MARKGGGKRIEPSFNAPARSPNLSARAEDRIVPGAKARAKAKAKGGSSRSRASRRRNPFVALLFRAGYWCVVLALWGGIAAVGLVVWYGAQMPSVAEWTVPGRPPNVRIVSRDGTLVANRGVTGGEAVPLAAMSPFIPQAVVAIEDRRFRSHWGVDPLGLARALFENAVSGRVSQGGSTLTQQLAKNLFLKPDRTLERKVQEVLLALWLEHEHSKDEILEMYLNRVYFGAGAYGVEAASRRYFNKSARDVTLTEAALLAGLLKAPSRLSPTRDPKAAEERAGLVLAAMREQGVIDAVALAEARSLPALRAAPYGSGSENYVADLAMSELPVLIGEPRADIVVETTVDMRLQKAAEGAIRRLVAERGKAFAVSQGALVALDGAGGLVACVGGVDYAGSQFDRATEARRQPGSAFKPFVYLAAVEAGMTPETTVDDAPVRFGRWRPENYKGEYFGRVTLAAALAKSLNSVAVQLAARVGPAAVIAAARRLGVASPLQSNLSIALGTSEVTPLELTAAYVPFMNGGLRPNVHVVEEVRTMKGEVLYKRPRAALPRVVSEDAASTMNRMMSETVRSGTGRKAGFGWPAAGKTGTTQNGRDAWFVGYTAHLTAGVWFGNDDGSPMRDVTGGSLPTLAWRDFMQAAHEGLAPAALPGMEQAVPLPAAAFPPPPPTPDAVAAIPPRDASRTKTRPGSIMDVILGN